MLSQMNEAERLQYLSPPEGKVSMVLDTDAYNEIDDQYAITYALLSPKHLDVEAIYAAPFYNARSEGPEDGMEKSYQEILNLLGKLDIPESDFVYRGSRGYLPAEDQPCESPAAADLVERAMATEPGRPLYVVAIGAITNVASALLIKPEIAERILVVWLGGQPLYWPTASEFNLKQDLFASQLIFDSGVPLVQIPCSGVASHLLTTVAEVERFAKGKGAIGDYLFEILTEYGPEGKAWSKVIWDISAIAYLKNPDWVQTELVHSPVLTDNVTYSVDRSRHLIRTASKVSRDAIFQDLFSKL